MDVQKELNVFISTNTGRNDVGDTTANKGQCVGLVESWIDIFGYPHIWGNAKDLLHNADPNFYEIILNTPDNFPQIGDIPVWDETWGNGDGHTAIAVDGCDINTLMVFEQNDHSPSDPSGLCEIVKHDYSHVKGWIRFKNLQVIKQPTDSVDWHGLNSNDSASVQIAINAWWDKANGKLVDKAKYDALQLDFDTYKKQYPQASPSPSEDQANYTEMKALGYTTIADINKALEAKDATTIALQKDQIILEQKNKKLADIIAADSSNNYTAMQQGIDATDKIKELENNIQEITKATEAEKPNVKDILNKIFQFKNVYNKFIEKIDKEEATQEEVQFAEQTIKAMQPQTKFNVSWLTNLFQLNPTKKEVN